MSLGVSIPPFSQRSEQRRIFWGRILLVSSILKRSERGNRRSEIQRTYLRPLNRSRVSLNCKWAHAKPLQDVSLDWVVLGKIRELAISTTVCHNPDRGGQVSITASRQEPSKIGQSLSRQVARATLEHLLYRGGHSLACLSVSMFDLFV